MNKIKTQKPAFLMSLDEINEAYKDISGSNTDNIIVREPSINNGNFKRITRFTEGEGYHSSSASMEPRLFRKVGI